MNKASSLSEIDEIFNFHKLTEDQLERYELIREAGKALAQAIVKYTPRCNDQTAAILKVREAVMIANFAINNHHFIKK